MNNKIAKERNILIIAILMIILIMITSLFYIKINERNKKNIVLKNTNNQITANNSIALMLETSYNTGEYAENDGSVWPTSGYTYNSELSRCEKGSKISYNASTKKVLVEANISDKCYVYFDKDISISIKSVTVTNITTTGFTVNITGNTNGTDNTYYISTNGGSTWTTIANKGTTASYTFNSLSSGTSYNVVVKMTKNGVTSSNYNYGSVTTTSKPTGTPPTITSATVDDNLYAEVVATQGSSAISGYEFCFYSYAGDRLKETCDIANEPYYDGSGGWITEFISVTAIDANGLRSNTWAF